MFDEKVAVVTGGASGIGLALAEAFGARGASIMLADLDEVGLAGAVRRLESEGVAVAGHVTDVTDAGSVEALAVEVERRFGGVDLVFNNAGVAVYGSAVDATPEDWEFALGVNLRGVVNGVRSFVPRLVEGGGGHIVNTASMSGLIGMEYLGVYCASKFAVVGLSESLARELKPSGIGVTVVCPMVVETPISENSLRMRPAALRNEEQEPLEVGELVGGVISAAEVAELVVDAVANGHFYVLTHREQGSILARRAQRLAEAAARLEV